MKSSAVDSALQIVTQTKREFFLSGLDVGKSDIVRQVAQASNRPVLDLKEVSLPSFEKVNP